MDQADQRVLVVQLDRGDPIDKDSNGKQWRIIKHGSARTRKSSLERTMINANMVENE